jgi:hypothetical protein
LDVGHFDKGAILGVKVWLMRFFFTLTDTLVMRFNLAAAAPGESSGARP